MEKLNAAQQLTATIIPSSTVNMMSNEDDQFIQSQEAGHNMQHCPHIIKYPLQEHQCHITRHIEINTPDQALDTAMKIKKEETGPDHSLNIVDIATPAIMPCTEAAPDHSKGMGTATIEAAQGNPIQHTEATVAEPIMTHHTADHPHTAAHQVTALGTTVDHVNAHPTDHQNIIHTTEDHAVQDHIPTREPENYTLVGKGRSI